MHLPDACKTEENEEWLEKKMYASKHAILQTMQFMDVPENSDDESEDSMHCKEDEDDPFTSGRKSSSRHIDEVMLSKDDVCLFLYQLQYNVCFDMGFKVTTGPSSAHKRCYCPCGNTMKPWREQFFLNGISGKGCKTSCDTIKGKNNMLPSALLGHCKDVHTGGCPIHYGIHSYVSTLHALFIRSKGEKKL